MPTPQSTQYPSVDMHAGMILRFPFNGMEAIGTGVQHMLEKTGFNYKREENMCVSLSRAEERSDTQGGVLLYHYAV